MKLINEAPRKSKNSVSPRWYLVVVSTRSDCSSSSWQITTAHLLPTSNWMEFGWCLFESSCANRIDTFEHESTNRSPSLTINSCSLNLLMFIKSRISQHFFCVRHRQITMPAAPAFNAHPMKIPRRIWAPNSWSLNWPSVVVTNWLQTELLVHGGEFRISTHEECSHLRINLECCVSRNSIPWPLSTHFSSAWTNTVEVHSFAPLAAANPAVSDRCGGRLVVNSNELSA